MELAGKTPDGRLNVPVLPRETLEVSLWATGPPAATIAATVTIYNSAGTDLTTVPVSAVALSLTTWRLAAADRGRGLVRREHQGPSLTM